MTANETAQLLMILAPMLQSAAIEGGKVIATIKSDLKQTDIDRSLELSRSVTWPALDFGLGR